MAAVIGLRLRLRVIRSRRVLRVLRVLGVLGVLRVVGVLAVVAHDAPFDQWVSPALAASEKGCETLGELARSIDDILSF
jgi:hypothetical protein